MGDLNLGIRRNDVIIITIKMLSFLKHWIKIYEKEGNATALQPWGGGGANRGKGIVRDLGEKKGYSDSINNPEAIDRELRTTVSPKKLKK